MELRAATGTTASKLGEGWEHLPDAGVMRQHRGLVGCLTRWRAMFSEARARHPR